MPFYRYSAIDQNGHTLDGTIQATTATEAMLLLKQRGLQVPRILAQTPSAPNAGRAPTPQHPNTPTPQRPNTPSPVTHATTARSPSGPVTRHPSPVTQASPLKINTPTYAGPQIYRTRKSTDKDIFFLFAQASEQLRAGINPAQAFGNLAALSRAKKFQQALGMISNTAMEGRPISSVMEQFPDLFPEHIVGTVRAGEVGGFIPEALATISEQAENAHKFKRFHWWIWLVSINALLSVPLVFLFRAALLGTWDQYEKAGGAGGPLVILQVFWKFFVWPYGPATLLMLALIWLARNFLSTRATRKFRHQAGLRMPVLGARARNESVTVFTWALAKLSKGGVPPNQAWSLAVASVPNLAMQDKFTHAGQMMNESTRLSDVVFKSKIFPDEYAPTVSTGELTGDVSGALERLSRVSRTEFEAGTVKSKVFTGSLGCTAVIITSGIVTIVLTWAYYHELIGKVTNVGDDQTTTSAPSSSTP